MSDAKRFWVRPDNVPTYTGAVEVVLASDFDASESARREAEAALLGTQKQLAAMWAERDALKFEENLLIDNLVRVQGERDALAATVERQRPLVEAAARVGGGEEAIAAMDEMEGRLRESSSAYIGDLQLTIVTALRAAAPVELTPLQRDHMDLTGSVVLNPSAIGDPDQTPIVQLSPDAARYFARESPRCADEPAPVALKSGELAKAFADVLANHAGTTASLVDTELTEALERVAVIALHKGEP